MAEDKKTVEEPQGLPVADFSSLLALPSEDVRWVEVPEWGVKFKMKSLTKAEMVRLRKESTPRGQKDVNEILLEMNLLHYSIVEPKLSLAQVDELFEKGNAKALSRLSAAALTLSGLTEDYIEQAEQDMKS